MNYTNENIKARLSDKTIGGMTLTIDDLAAIGRVLSIQDDAYDEQFEKIHKKLDKIQKVLDNHEKRITCLEKQFAKHIENHEKIRA